MTYVIAEPCADVKDKACIEECPVDCIYEGARMLYIHPDERVDCGAREPVCPVEAIFYEDDVPEVGAATHGSTPTSSQNSVHPAAQRKSGWPSTTRSQ
jgi:NAD-dependent dihydropyrimidine dehydrogenase PreA subunit